jgi:hypothetical protein
VYWQRGETIVQRYVGHGDGVLWAYPHIVLEDEPARTILFQPEGTLLVSWSMDEKRYEEPMTAHMHALRFIYPDAPYHVTMWFDAGTGVPPWWEPHLGSVEGRFKGWKVDMSAPHRRTKIGFDTTDDVLDFIVHPDGSWYMKDDQDLTLYTARGIYTAEEAARIRRDASGILPSIEARVSPFDDEWTDWQPPAGINIGAVPEHWTDIPGGDLHLSTLAYERGQPGRRYDAWRQP